MLRPVEVLHHGQWVAATLLNIRLDQNGWHGLVGYSDPITREGFYHWCPHGQLRATTADQTDDRQTPQGPGPESTTLAPAPSNPSGTT